MWASKLVIYFLVYISQVACKIESIIVSCSRKRVEPQRDGITNHSQGESEFLDSDLPNSQMFKNHL